MFYVKFQHHWWVHADQVSAIVVSVSGCHLSKYKCKALGILSNNFDILIMWNITNGISQQFAN